MAEYPRPMLECAMQTVTVPSGGFASTQRVDRWWIAPTTTAAGLFLLFGYLTFRAFNPSLTPPSCAVGGVPQRYRGETRLFLIQNLHRYTLYGALFLIACRWWEGLSAFFRNGQFGIGVGTVVMLGRERDIAVGVPVWMPLVASPHRGAARLANSPYMDSSRLSSGRFVTRCPSSGCGRISGAWRASASWPTWIVAHRGPIVVPASSARAAIGPAVSVGPKGHGHVTR